MADATVYDDGLVRLDVEGITLRRYYFPSGARKFVCYSRIRRAWKRPMGWLTGKGRIWGTSHPRYWLPFDMSRPRKSALVVLDVGGRVRPAFSPDDPERVMAILRANTAGEIVCGESG